MVHKNVLLSSVLLSILLAINVQSYNLLCDTTINWIQYSTPDTYKFNHTTCKVSISYSTNPMEPRLFSVSSIFNNPSNYPINFTIHGQAYNGNAVAQIIFKILNAGLWGYSEPFSNNIPQELTYMWETPDDITYTTYKDKTLNSVNSHSTHKASTIIEIGMAVYTDQFDEFANNILILDNVYLNALTLPPTTNSPTTH
eukprot:42766_1